MQFLPPRIIRCFRVVGVIYSKMNVYLFGIFFSLLNGSFG